MKPAQVDRAIWIDFEGTTTEPPSMLGVLWTPDNAAAPELTQYVFDEGLRLAAEGSDFATGEHDRIVVADLDQTLRELINLSNSTGRHLASWTLYDYNVIVEQLGRVAVRFRNAKATAKRWRRGRTQLAPHLPDVEFPKEELQRYLRLVGYDVPTEVQGDAATNIRYVRERSARKGSWADVSTGGKHSWQRLVEHNVHDLHGMRAVTRIAAGLDGLPEAVDSNTSGATA